MSIAESLGKINDRSVIRDSSTRDLLLMSADTLVMRINFDESRFEVLDELHLPFDLKGRLRETPASTGNYKYDLTQSLIVSRKNAAAVMSWLSHRTLLLSRANAKWIYNLLKFDQVDTEAQRVKISLVCRSVSILDNYWVKIDGDNISWDKVDVRRNPLNEVIAQVALHGKSLTLQGSLTTPELTTDGAYAKAWRRHEDGLWLYKLGSNGNTESRIEVMVSNLLDKTNARHVPYYAGEDEGKYVCMCPSISTPEKSLLPAMDFISYCNANGLNADVEAPRIDSEGIYHMWIVDYLISNRDRHSRNWGFFYNQDRMEILSTHDLFDHNNAFDIEYINNPDAPYQCTGKTMRQSAKEAVSKCEFRITGNIAKEDFITVRQYDSFMSRAEELHLL